MFKCLSPLIGNICVSSLIGQIGDNTNWSESSDCCGIKQSCPLIVEFQVVSLLVLCMGSLIVHICEFPVIGQIYDSCDWSYVPQSHLSRLLLLGMYGPPQGVNHYGRIPIQSLT